MVSDRLLDTSRKACAALDGVGIEFALFGGLAVNAWERFRHTNDADFILAVENPDLDAIRDAMRAAGFAHLRKADTIRLETCGVLRFWHPAGETGFSVKVDVILGHLPFHKKVIERRVFRQLFDFTYPLASVEDCILLKLLAARAIDMVDAAELLRIHRDTVDGLYMRTQAEELGVLDRLHQIETDAKAGNPF